MATRRSEHAQSPAPQSAAHAGAGSVALFAGCGLALVVARHVLPAESAHLGETLWIVALWLLLAFAWSVARWRFDAPHWRFDRGDLAIVLLAAGHVVAGLATDGNLRAALNGLWEWVGVALSVCLLRRWLATDARRQQWLAVIAVAGIVLAGLGVAQFAVTYPELRTQLDELTQLEQQASSHGLTAQEAARFQQLQIELGQLATETDPNVRYGLRQRLLASTEPLACFALANTLAGVLSVSLLLLLGGAHAALVDRQSWLRIARIAAPALLVAFCLVLTKSRTAWIGSFVGGFAWWIFEKRGSLLTRRTLTFAVVGLLVILVLAGAAWSAGALDRLVVLESLKSLRYRLEYWTGAWGVIRDHLVLGVGPGNFRQNYLRHKVAGSSEEILDPHNLFLDVWANGGLLAFTGLLIAAGIAAVLWRRAAAQRPNAVQRETIARAAGASRFVLLSGTAGIALVWLKLGLIDMQWDPRLISLAGGWMLAALILPPLRCSAASQMAAGIALGVHLLGAGGISMPVISVTLLLLWLGPATPVAAATAAGAMSPAGRRAAIAGCIVLGALIPTCLLTALIPSTLSNLYTNAAISVMTQRGDAPAARRLLDQAIRADGLDPLPYVFRAQLEHDQARRLGDPSGANVEMALSYLRDAVVRDPENPKTYWLKSQWDLQQFERLRQRESLSGAVEAAESAASRDPQNAAILATLASVYVAADRGDDARAAAIRALKIDQLNRQLGHYDRLLDEPTRSRLSDLTADR